MVTSPRLASAAARTWMPSLRTPSSFVTRIVGIGISLHAPPVLKFRRHTGLSGSGLPPVRFSHRRRPTAHGPSPAAHRPPPPPAYNPPRLIFRGGPDGLVAVAGARTRPDRAGAGLAG